MSELYRKKLREDNDAYVSVRYENEVISYKLCDGINTAFLAFCPSFESVHDYENFVTDIEGIKIACNTALDEAADQFAQVQNNYMATAYEAFKDQVDMGAVDDSVQE